MSLKGRRELDRILKEMIVRVRDPACSKAEREKIWSDFSHLLLPSVYHIGLKVVPQARELDSSDIMAALLESFNGIISAVEKGTYEPRDAARVTSYAGAAFRYALLGKLNERRVLPVDPKILEHTVVDPEGGALSFEPEQLAKMIAYTTKDLTPHQKKILRLRGGGKTLEEAGRIAGGISKEGVRQVQKRAYLHVRANLQDYLKQDTHFNEKERQNILNLGDTDLALLFHMYLFENN